MATDYDAPRTNEPGPEDESLEALKAEQTNRHSPKVDEDEVEAAESFELPGADLSHESLTLQVTPQQDDEFTCRSCFLVHHRAALLDRDMMLCRDCA